MSYISDTSARNMGTYRWRDRARRSYRDNPWSMEHVRLSPSKRCMVTEPVCVWCDMGRVAASDKPNPCHPYDKMAGLSHALTASLWHTARLSSCNIGRLESPASQIPLRIRAQPAVNESLKIDASSSSSSSKLLRCSTKAKQRLWDDTLHLLSVRKSESSLKVACLVHQSLCGASTCLGLRGWWLWPVRQWS